MEGKDTVLLRHRHDVGGDAHRTKVEQGNEAREGDAVVLGKGLHQLESHSATTEVLERIGVVLALGIEDGHGIRHHVVGHVMVADNKINTYALGISNLLDGLDATVEDDNQFHTRLFGIFQSFLADAIPLVVTVGDIVVNVGIELLKKLIHQCYRRAAVHVVVAIYQYPLLSSHGIVEPVYGYVHVLHQERVDKVG